MNPAFEIVDVRLDRHEPKWSFGLSPIGTASNLSLNAEFYQYWD
jgi:hypothetical protein